MGSSPCDLPLQRAGFCVAHIQADDVRPPIWEENPALILLDHTGDARNLSMLRDVRARSSTPVIMLAPDGASDVKVAGLEEGADDVIAEPLDPRELVARVRSLLRRVQLDQRSAAARGAPPTIAKFNGWEFCSHSRRLVGPSGQRVPLTTREFDLLAALIANAGEPVSRDYLMKAVAGVTWKAIDRRIDVLVSRLRKKLHSYDPSGKALIETVRCAGYQLVARVAYD